jgi:mono/diheme cytochrome c family protein
MQNIRHTYAPSSPQNQPLSGIVLVKRRALRYTRYLIRIVGIGLLLLFLVSCSGATPTDAPPPTPAFAEGSLEAQGVALFAGKGRCAACHSLSPDTVIVGPSLAGIATTAATRIEGLSAEEYIEESILRPDMFRPAGFENEQMDTSLAKQLTIEEVEALVAYLMTFK